MPLDQLGAWLHTLYILLRHNDEKAFFLVLLIEEAGVPLPFMPGDMFIMLAGYRASTGDMSIWEAAVSVILAVQMGSTILYLLSRRLGHAIIVRFGKYIHLDQAKLDKVERWVQERGPVMILVGRLTPGLRTPTSIMAGVFQIPFHQFLFFTTLSALIWSIFWLALGYFFGTSLLPLTRYFHSPQLFVVVGVMVLLAGGVMLQWRRHQRKKILAAEDVSIVVSTSESGGQL